MKRQKDLLPLINFTAEILRETKKTPVLNAENAVMRHLTRKHLTRKLNVDPTGKIFGLLFELVPQARKQ